MLKSRYFMKIDWNIFREKRCLHCLSPFTAQADGSLLHKHIHTHLCPQCAAELAEMKSGFCLHCGQALSDPKAAPVRCGQCGGTADLWQSFAFYMQYSAVFRELILKAKFNENRACAKFLGELLAYLVLERFPEQRKFDVLPMPLHSRRLIKRGYNQCLEILKFFKICLEKHSECRADIHGSILRKKVFTVPQSSLDKKERQKNIKNSFAVMPHTLREIFLFDDIATTNSTLSEACRELKKSGVQTIHIIVLAKA